MEGRTGHIEYMKKPLVKREKNSNQSVVKKKIKKTLNPAVRILSEFILMVLEVKMGVDTPKLVLVYF